jgi:hypothetical protein
VQADLNPFVYSRPIAPEDVIDRDDETRQLLALAAGGHYARLSAPRKYGKTSLLRRVLRDAERGEGMVPILVDLYGVVSLADVTVRVERAYARHLKGRLRARIDELLQSTGLGLSLSAMGIGARLHLEPRASPLPALHALLDLPLRLGDGVDRRALIVFDEFQDVAKVGDIDAIIRSHIQFQGEVASYIFSGSEPGLMRQLFDEHERPLYGQAAPVELGRLPDPDIAAYVVDRFRGTGREAGEAVGPLLAAASGHPQRAMLLAHRVWEEVPLGASATLADWSRALEATLVQLQPELDAHWQRLTPTEQKTVRAVVAGQGSPYRTAVLARLDLGKASAQEALRNLAARAEVESGADGYVLVDPLFALWIERLREGAPVPLEEE